MSEITALTGTGAATLLLTKLFAKPAQELGEFFSDVVRGWRMENWTRTAERVQKKLRDRGLPFDVKPLPIGIGLALVEAIVREDNEELQALWANLIANHTDPKAEVELDKDLIEVVRHLSVLDARLMTYLSEVSGQSADIHAVLDGGFDVPRLAEELAVPAARVARSINNLWRLGCLLQQAAGPHRLDGAALRVVGPTAESNVSYQLSPLGEAILRAVRP